jgi:hypothetical protein
MNQSIDGNSPYNVMETKFRCEILDLNDGHDGLSGQKRGKFKFSMFERKNLEFNFSKQVLEYFLCFAAGKSESFMRERGNCQVYNATSVNLMTQFTLDPDSDICAEDLKGISSQNSSNSESRRNIDMPKRRKVPFKKMGKILPGGSIYFPMELLEKFEIQDFAGNFSHRDRQHLSPKTSIITLENGLLAIIESPPTPPPTPALFITLTHKFYSLNFTELNFKITTINTPNPHTINHHSPLSPSIFKKIETMLTKRSSNPQEKIKIITQLLRKSLPQPAEKSLLFPIDNFAAQDPTYKPTFENFTLTSEWKPFSLQNICSVAYSYGFGDSEGYSVVVLDVFIVGS